MPITVDQAVEIFQRLKLRRNGDAILAIPYESGHRAIGGMTQTPVQSIAQGCDWDKGKIFITPTLELGAKGSELEFLKAQLHAANEVIQFVYMALKTPRLSAQGKVEAAISHVEGYLNKDNG